jgi:hypothetical protein
MGISCGEVSVPWQLITMSTGLAVSKFIMEKGPLIREQNISLGFMLLSVIVYCTPLKFGHPDDTGGAPVQLDMLLVLPQIESDAVN